MAAQVEEQVGEILAGVDEVVLATHGPAGLQVGFAQAAAHGAALYVMLPRQSDQVFNLESEAEVVALTAGWILHGRAGPAVPPAAIARRWRWEPAWMACARVDVARLHVLESGRLSYRETLDLGGGVSQAAPVTRAPRPRGTAAGSADPA